MIHTEFGVNMSVIKTFLYTPVLHTTTLYIISSAFSRRVWLADTRTTCRGFSVVRQDPERNGVRGIHACVDAWSDLLDIFADHVGLFTAHREPDPCRVHVRQAAADDQQHRPHPSRGWPTARVTIEAHLYFICFRGDEPIRSWRRSRQSHVSWVLCSSCSWPRV